MECVITSGRVVNHNWVVAVFKVDESTCQILLDEADDVTFGFFQ